MTPLDTFLFLVLAILIPIFTIILFLIKREKDNFLKENKDLKNKLENMNNKHSISKNTIKYIPNNEKGLKIDTHRPLTLYGNQIEGKLYEILIRSRSLRK